MLILTLLGLLRLNKYNCIFLKVIKEKINRFRTKAKPVKTENATILMRLLISITDRLHFKGYFFHYLQIHNFTSNFSYPSLLV